MFTERERKVQELVDLSSLAGGSVPEMVVWISQHKLTEDQKSALLNLHQGHVLVLLLDDVIFRDAGHLARTILANLKIGVVYVVAPQWQLKEIQSGRHGQGIVFRTFAGYLNSNKDYNFTGIDELCSDPKVGQVRLYRVNDLNWQRGRQPRSQMTVVAV